MYAKWQVNTYTVTLQHAIFGLPAGTGNWNNGQHKFATTSFTANYGEEVTYGTDRAVALPNGFRLYNMASNSYTSDASWDSYAWGAKIAQPAKNTFMNLYYQPITYTISYNMNGGTNNASNPANINVLYGVTFKCRVILEVAGINLLNRCIKFINLI